MFLSSLLLADVAVTGCTFIFQIAAMSNIAQGGGAGLAGIISIRSNDVTSYVIGMLISFVSAFILTFALVLRVQKK